MPPATALPDILTKSIALALAAGLAAGYFKRVSIPILAGVVLAYQLVGTGIDWAVEGDFFKAVQDFRIGVPGMLIQITGGWLVIKYLLRK